MLMWCPCNAFIQWLIFLAWPVVSMTMNIKSIFNEFTDGLWCYLGQTVINQDLFYMDYNMNDVKVSSPSPYLDLPVFDPPASHFDLTKHSISLMVFHGELRSMEISLFSYPYPNELITSYFCTWHDSYDVMACVNNCGDLISKNSIAVQQKFTFELWQINHHCNGSQGHHGSCEVPFFDITNWGPDTMDVRWNYLFIPKLQWLHHWSLEMVK